MAVNVYGMLTSKSINPSVMPGITRALEKYILLHNLKDGELLDNKKVRIKGNKFVFESGELEIHTEQAGPGTKGSAPTGRGGKKPGDRVEKVEIHEPKQSDALTLSPTFVYVTNPKTGQTEVVGVKVIPFVVENDAALIQGMLSDKGLKGLGAKIKRYERSIVKFGYRLWHKTIANIPFMPGEHPLTGDPRKDVILNTSTFKENVFVCLNKIDIPENFFTSASDIQKLFGLNWTSLIFCDDVNKMASFCMRDYKGVCSTIPYSYLYAFSKEASKVYEDITDVKKSAGPIFRRKASITKLLGESKAINKKNEFIKEFSDYVDLNEQLVDKSKIKIMLSNLASGIKSKNINSIKRVVNNVKVDADINKIDIMASKAVGSEYNKINQFVKKVIANSVQISDVYLKSISAIVSMSAISSKEDNMKAAKKILKGIVPKLRTLNLSSDTITKDTFLALIVIIITSAIGVTGAGLAWGLVSSLWAWWPVGAVITLLAILKIIIMTIKE